MVATEQVSLTVVDNMQLSTTSVPLTLASRLYKAENKFTITNPGPGAGNITYSTTTSGGSWLQGGGNNCSAVPAGGSCEGKFYVRAVDLAPGSYSGTVNVTSNGGLTKKITVNLSVVNNIEVSPSSLSATVASGLYSQGHEFTITNPGPGSGTISYSVTGTTSWDNWWSFVGGSGCNAVPAGGSCTGTATFYNPTLPPGNYSGNIKITPVSAGSIPKNISFSLAVKDNMELSMSSVSASVTPGCSANTNKSITLKNPGPGTGTVGYSVSSNKSWLSTGTTGCSSVAAGGSCTIGVGFNTGGMSQGTYTGSATITGGGVTKAIPVTLAINQKPSVSYGAGSFTSCSAYESSFTISSVRSLKF